MTSMMALFLFATQCVLGQADIRAALTLNLSGERLHRDAEDELHRRPAEVADLLIEMIPDLEGDQRRRAYSWVEGLMAPRKAQSLDETTIHELSRLAAEQLARQAVELDDTSLRNVLLHTLNKAGQYGYDDGTAESILESARYAVRVAPSEPRILGRLLSLVGYTHRPDALDVIARVQNVYSYDGREAYSGPVAWKFAPTWNALKASARLYQSSDIDAALAKIREAGWQTSMDELVYIRQPQVVDFLVGFLNEEGCEPYPSDGGDVMAQAPDCVYAAATIVRMYPALEAEFGAIANSPNGFADNMDAIAFVNAWLAVPGNRESLRDGLPEIEPPARPEVG